MEENKENVQEIVQTRTKYCKFCAAKIPEDAIICTNCGRQVEQLRHEQPQVIVNNTNANSNINHNINGGKRAVNKWTSFILCLLLGWMGVHKFYEGKIGAGILYLCTGGLCGLMWLIDCIAILAKPNPYYV